MRRAAAFALFVTFAVLPVTAEAGDQFGRAITRTSCRTEFLCPSAVADPNIDYYKGLIDMANGCIKTGFALDTPGGFLDVSYPDGNGCFTTKTLPPAPSGGTNMAPKCCIVMKEGSSRSCGILCTLHESR